MALSLYNIKKWYLMLTGKSVLHVNQSIGQYYDITSIKGYYNNMKEKVFLAPDYVESQEFPFIKTENGDLFYFPVGVFQYAFGLLDLYLETKEAKYLDKFKQCSEWAINHQLENGAWDNFSFYYPNNPYGGMAQGEGASLLIRAYKFFNEERYLQAAKKAIDFMLLDKINGGCTSYVENEVVLLEYPHRKAVLNGWVFAWWGLYDYVLLTDDSKYRTIMEQSCQTLVKKLPQFKNSYWSIYDLDKRIASPFYHNLHIAQMEAMYALTNVTIFKQYAQVWRRQQKNPICKTIAFIYKAYQKIIEK